MSTWRATEADLDAALAAMADRPPWPTVTADPRSAAWRTAYLICIGGDTEGSVAVARCDLAEAVRRVQQGALGHPWHPSPPEFRRLCDRVHVDRRVGRCVS